MKSLLALALMATTAIAAPAKKEAALYNLDQSATKVEWIGKKVAGPHNGYVTVKNGTMTATEDGTITQGTVVIDMNSMTNVDVTDKEYNGKLIEHLKSPDFFDTTKFPEATLVIKNSKKSSKGLEVNGDLTIRGITQPVRFLATDVKATADSFMAKATVTVDRTKHQVMYNAGKGDKSVIKQLGDKLIYDEFTLNIQLAAKK